MRQIIFRGWNQNQNVMYSHYELSNDQLTLDTNNRGFMNVNSDNLNLTEYYHHIIPLQYIGINDKNNEMIFEGDILKNPNGILYVVEYSLSLCTFVLIKIDNIEIYQSININYVSQMLSIVGNIYENKELFKNDN